MSRGAFLVLGLAVGGAVGFWIGRGSGGESVVHAESESPRLEQANESSSGVQTVEPPRTEEARIAAEGRPARAASQKPAAVRSADEFLAAIHGLLDDPDRSDKKVERLLSDWIATGDSAAVEFALDLMANRRLRSSSRFWAGLFAAVEDDRIGGMASKVLELNLSEGLDSHPYTTGFVTLMLTKGGAPEAEAILGYALEGRLYMSAELIGDLGGKVSAQPLLESLEQGSNSIAARNIAEGLGAWNDPATTSELWRLALGPDANPAYRRGLLTGIAYHVPAAEVERYMAKYWALEDAEERAAMLSSLGYLGYVERGKGFSASALRKLEEIVVHGLAAPTRNERSSALYRVEYDERLHTDEMLARLRTMEARATDPNELDQLKQTIGEMQFSLR